MTTDQGQTRFKKNMIMAKLTRYSSFEELKSSHIVTANKTTNDEERPSALEALFVYLKEETLKKEIGSIHKSRDK